jgi:hypothetical protein
MKRYIVNNREVTKTEWAAAFRKHQEATIILRTPSMPSVYQPPSSTAPPISLEKLKKIKELYKR